MLIINNWNNRHTLTKLITTLNEITNIRSVYFWLRIFRLLRQFFLFCVWYGDFILHNILEPFGILYSSILHNNFSGVIRQNVLYNVYTVQVDVEVIKSINRFMHNGKFVVDLVWLTKTYNRSKAIDMVGIIDFTIDK